MSVVNKNNKINLLDINRQQMRNFLKEINEEPFHADQIMKWIYHYYCDNFYEMTNINKSLRNKLTQIAEIKAPEVINALHSSDGTIKWIISIGDQCVEMVYMQTNKRHATLCISSQIGCALRCKFCYTARQGFNRNLRVSEIIGQVWRASKMITIAKSNNMAPITNIVIMGMGEPLLNLTNLVPAIEIMLDDLGFHFSKRHITISTAGISPAVDKLSNMIDVRLAISLHAPNDIIRNKIMPINKKYNIKTLFDAVQRYLKKSSANHGHITVEYVMLDHINDFAEHAYQLARLLKKIPCKINLIPWNSFPGATYSRSSNNRIHYFCTILKSYGFIVIIRKTLGDDINAACGQLSGHVINRTRYRVMP